MGAPMVMNMDNQGVSKLLHTESVNCRTKHIDFQYHFTRHVVCDGLVVLKYCPTDEMHADMLIGSLGRTLKERMRTVVGVCIVVNSTTQGPKRVLKVLWYCRAVQCFFVETMVHHWIDGVWSLLSACMLAP